MSESARRSRFRFHILSLGLFTAMLAGASALGAAQVNIERLRGGEATEGFANSLGLDFSIRYGNVDIQRVGVETRTDYVRGAHTALLLIQGRFGWNDGEQFSDEGLAHLRYTFQLSERVLPELFVQADFDSPRRLEFRALIGGGFRFGLHDGERVSTWLGTDYMLEHERLDVSETSVVEPEVTVHRWSNYVTANLDFGERAGGSLTVYAQPRFDALEDARVLGEARFDARLVGAVALTLTFRLRHDTRPPTDTKSLDAEVTSGVLIRF